MGLNSGQNKPVHDILKYNLLLNPVYVLARDVHLFLTNKRFKDEQFIKLKFRKYQDYDLNLKEPKTLNEKLQWLKIHEHKDFHVKLADKFKAREFIAEKFGDQYLIPLLYETKDYRDLRPENLPDPPFVVKTNHGFGNTVIVRDKNDINWKHLRMDFKRWLRKNYYYEEREWQYKDIEPRIIVERMLLDKRGKLPNDYKLNFIEGKPEFIYVSVDREGSNKRNIYSPEWEAMNFTWARKGKDLSHIRGEEIEPPPTLDKMIEFGKVIATMYKYVRVDFYDVDGTLYFGEITQCHGGGFDRMTPYDFDLMFGEKIQL